MKKYTFKDFIEKNIVIAFNNKEEVIAFLNESVKRKLVSSSYIDKYHKSSVSSAMKNKRYGYFIAERLGLVISLVPPSPVAWEQINYKDFAFDDCSKEIHITVKGNQTHAILKENGKVIKHEVAKCHPDDEFDFENGAKLAFDRLFDKDEVIENYKEDGFLNCSFEVFSTNSSYLTEGKVYDVANGRFYCNNALFPLSNTLKSFIELEDYLDGSKLGVTCFEKSNVTKIKPINKVQRLAKVGEYIMIVNPVLSYGYYDKCDIGVANGGDEFHTDTASSYKIIEIEVEDNG